MDNQKDTFNFEEHLDQLLVKLDKNKSTFFKEESISQDI